MDNRIGLNAPCREKYWREKTAEEKLDVVADLLAEAHREIRNLNERLDELGNHAHHPITAIVLVPPRDQHAFSRYSPPPGYCREDFMLGRSPTEHYGTASPAAPSWAEEAKVEGALPTGAPAAAPAVEPLPASGEAWPMPAPAGPGGPI